MNPIIETARPPAKATGRRYESVKDLVAKEGIPTDVQNKLDELRRDTRVVNQLTRLRVCSGLTQEEMANHLGVTQSAISKLESGRDEEVTLREIREYARATSQRIGVIFGKPLTHVEAIKLYADGLKTELEALAELASQDNELESEIKNFFGEAWYNLFAILATCSGKLPSGSNDLEVSIKIIKTSTSTTPLLPMRSMRPTAVA